MPGKIKGKRRRGWQRMGWLDGITELNGHEFAKTLGDSNGQRSLVCCSSWGHKESDWVTQQQQQQWTKQSSSLILFVRKGERISGRWWASKEMNGQCTLWLWCWVHWRKQNRGVGCTRTEREYSSSLRRWHFCWDLSDKRSQLYGAPEPRQRELDMAKSLGRGRFGMCGWQGGSNGRRAENMVRQWEQDGHVSFKQKI